jgi:hypothetical protein
MTPKILPCDKKIWFVSIGDDDGWYCHTKEEVHKVLTKKTLTKNATIHIFYDTFRNFRATDEYMKMMRSLIK